MGAYAFFDFFLLVSGVIALTLSLIWRAENPLLNIILTPNYLTAGTVLGVALLITFAISIAAIVQRNHVTGGLVLLNYILVLDALGIVVIGTFIWAFTLAERNNFHARYAAASPAIRIALQDKLQCCGYFDATDLVEIGGSFCQSQDFVNNLQANVTTNFCVTPLTNIGDEILNNVFTTTYGFMAVVLCLLLTSLCVIRKRQEDERFKRIDAKRGTAFV